MLMNAGNQRQGAEQMIYNISNVVGSSASF